MSKTRSIEEIRRSIASLVAEAEAALSVAGSEPAQPAGQTPRAAAPPERQMTPAPAPRAAAPSKAPMVDLSDPSEELPPMEQNSALEETARPLIEKWIAEELPALAERLVRAQIERTRRQ